MTTPPTTAENESAATRDPVNEVDAISIQLQRARIDLGLSIVELSKLTGISKTVLHGYERARTKPGAREIRLLCAALRISPNLLILGSEDFQTHPSEFTSFYRKVRARPELAAVFYTMCFPLMASILDEEEVRNVLHIISALVKARSPEISDTWMAAAQHAMTAIDGITLPDGALTIPEDELQALIRKTQASFPDSLNKLNP